ncbi:hypothetical protein IFM89_010764 [Coptis chinensis]|uniref:Uncharacterized protein n=1 Tax=Coptis chinensis TaxID=261450 RepID=A0A835IMV6_9MAGN|nr:hypothetical protein IFM89_010764 [Coptis chinensis]
MEPAAHNEMGRPTGQRFTAQGGATAIESRQASLFDKQNLEISNVWCVCLSWYKYGQYRKKEFPDRNVDLYASYIVESLSR